MFLMVFLMSQVLYVTDALMGGGSLRRSCQGVVMYAVAALRCCTWRTRAC